MNISIGLGDDTKEEDSFLSKVKSLFGDAKETDPKKIKLWLFIGAVVSIVIGIALLLISSSIGKEKKEEKKVEKESSKQPKETEADRETNPVKTVIK
jgi:large-conductance mechanosensitive channel